MAKETTNSLGNFEFDEAPTFFEINEEGNTQADNLKEIKTSGTQDESGEGGGKSKEETTDLKDKKTKDEEEEEDKEPTFFGEEEEKEKVDEKKEDEEEDEVEVEAKDKGKEKKEQKEEDKPENEDKFFTTLASELKEKGIFNNIELKEGEEISEEKFFELQDEEVEARVQETFESFFEEMDADAKEFLKFKKNGGKTADFFATYGTGFELEEFDETNADHINRTLTHYLTTVEKLDSDELKDRLEWLKEGGKEKSYATKYFNTIKEAEQKQKEAITKAAEAVSKTKAENIKTFNESLAEVIAKTEEVGMFVITKAEQKELGSYITKPSVKVGKNKYVPPFNAELGKVLRAETPEDKQKLILLAKLFKSNFDTKDIKTKVETDVTKKVKSKLQDAKKGVKTASSGSYTKKGLSDYFSN